MEFPLNTMRIAIVTNSLAGNGRAISLSQQIQNLLTLRKINSQIFRENEWGERVSDFDQVWIVGGDGTLNYFVNKYSDIKKPLSIFNGGTGNDFYSLLYTKMTVENQVQYLLRSTPKAIDVGKCNDRFFLNGVGIGFEGAVVKSLSKTRKFKGKTSFFIHILKHILFYKENEFSITSEGKTIDRKCFMISIANGKRYGGGFYVAPLAQPNDGLLDAIIVKELSILKRLRYLPVIEKGKHLSLSFIEYSRTNKISIANKNDLIQAHVDGEYLESKELVIEILPSHLSFIY